MLILIVDLLCFKGSANSLSKPMESFPYSEVISPHPTFQCLLKPSFLCLSRPWRQTDLSILALLLTGWGSVILRLCAWFFVYNGESNSYSSKNCRRVLRE